MSTHRSLWCWATASLRVGTTLTGPRPDRMDHGGPESGHATAGRTRHVPLPRLRGFRGPGHDYGDIEKKGFPKRVFAENGKDVIK
jgi:hypothetical protein